MKRKVVFILGLSRVGSTLLDLVLGSTPQAVGLGEVYDTLQFDWKSGYGTRTCSCGKSCCRCPFWKHVFKRLKANPNATMEGRYLTLLDCFDSLYGRDKIMVDSSKWLAALKVLAGIEDIELKIIYLLRDVRAWTISRLDRRYHHPHIFTADGYYSKRLEESFGKKTRLVRFMIPAITRRPSYYFLIWYWQNLRIANHLSQAGLSGLQIGYDELGMNPNETMKLIFSYLDIPMETDTFSSINSQSHVLVGNYRKADPQRRRGIFYDNRWVYRNEWLWPAAVFPGIMKYNTGHVYRNISKQTIWKQQPGRPW